MENSRRQLPAAALAMRSPHPNIAHPNGLLPNSMQQDNGTNLKPTWTGFIHSTWDALIILEACLQGSLTHIPRRPHDRERANIITSGNIFIYEENASGIKRWTDGVTWSPSRIMGNFLVYRELTEPFPAGEKKKARKRKRGAEKDPSEQLNAQSEQDRKLVGSLVDSYGFKPGGLIKKTLNVRLRGVNHHIVSYYNVDDIKSGQYLRPVCDYNHIYYLPRNQILCDNQWKAPLQQEEDIDCFQEGVGNFQLVHNMMHRSMTMPLPEPSGAMVHDSPLNTHAALDHGSQTAGHSLPPSTHCQGNPHQYISSTPVQQVQTLPMYSDHQSIGAALGATHGNPLRADVMGDQITALGQYQANHTAVPSSNSYHQSVSPSSPRSQQWHGADTNDFKLLAPKRRQTSGPPTTNFPPDSLSHPTFFTSIHHPGGASHQDSMFLFDPFPNSMLDPIPREQGVARAH